MSLCCPVSVKRHHEGPALVIVIFCRLVLAFGANRFRGEKYHSFSVVMLYSHVFPADLTVTYTVWFNFVLELPYIVKLRVNVGQIVVFLRTTRGCQATKQGIFPTGILLTYSSNAPLGGWKTKILVQEVFKREAGRKQELYCLPWKLTLELQRDAAVPIKIVNGLDI